MMDLSFIVAFLCGSWPLTPHSAQSIISMTSPRFALAMLLLFLQSRHIQAGSLMVEGSSPFCGLTSSPLAYAGISHSLPRKQLALNGDEDDSSRDWSCNNRLSQTQNVCDSDG